MLWVKAFHIIFMTTWFAGLFYLPRLFVYHCDVTSETSYLRFCTMERKLFVIASIGMLGTLVFGVWLLLLVPEFLQSRWLHAKLALVLGLLAYHHWLLLPMRKFRKRRNTASAKFYRAMNELPAVFLVGIVILVVVKPF